MMYPVKRWKKVNGGIATLFRQCPECGALVHGYGEDGAQLHLEFHERIDAAAAPAAAAGLEYEDLEVLAAPRVVDWRAGLRQALGVFRRPAPAGPPPGVLPGPLEALPGAPGRDEQWQRLGALMDRVGEKR